MRVSVFVDGNNFYGMELNQHWFVDLSKLLRYISSEYGSIVDASYYLAKEVDDHDQDNFLKALPNVGFSLVLKPIKIITTENDDIKKGNLDVEIALSMVTSAGLYDCAVLVSGDSDFECIYRYLKSIGKEVIVISSHKSISSELRLAAGMHYIDVESIKDKVLRPQREIDS